MLLAAALLSTLSCSASAGSWQALTPSAWDELQGRGGVALIHFASRDCGVCPAQKDALRRILEEDGGPPVAGFEAALGANPAIESRYAVTSASTTLLLRDGREVARAVGLADEGDLRAFIERAFLLKRWGSPKARPSNRLAPRP